MLPVAVEANPSSRSRVFGGQLKGRQHGVEIGDEEEGEGIALAASLRGLYPMTCGHQVALRGAFKLFANVDNVGLWHWFNIDPAVLCFDLKPGMSQAQYRAV